MKNSSFEPVRLASEFATATAYDNHSIARANDHVVRISTMTEAYHWHYHPNSDEVFLALEGGIYIDFEDQTVELPPGHMLVVDRGVIHRTRPVRDRSVNLTFERQDLQTEKVTSLRTSGC